MKYLRAPKLIYYKFSLGNMASTQVKWIFTRSIGMYFKNLNNTFKKPETINILKWMLGWHDEARPKSPSTGVLVPYHYNDGKVLKKSNHDTLTWIGQASFLIQLGGKNILIDPVLSSSLGWYKRNSPPGLTLATLPKIDIVLITHNHRDHMDAPTLQKLGSDPIYVIPKGLGVWFKKNGLDRIVEMGWWQQENIEGINISFVPAEHWSRRTLTDTNTSWWGGFIIERDGIFTYHAGDTGWFDGFEMIAEKYPKIHAALLPIGAYAPRWFMKTQHVNPDEAVRIFTTLKANYFISMHWGTFKLSDEPLDEPPVALRLAWEQQNLPDKPLKIPAIGETLFFDTMD